MPWQPQDFGRSVTPTYHLLRLGGVDYANHITTGTARFSDFPTALFCGQIICSQMQSPSPHNIQAKVYLQY